MTRPWLSAQRTLALLIVAMTISPSRAEMISVDEHPIGTPPPGFSIALTGSGGPATWEVRKAPTDLPGNVIAQTSAEAVDNRFPLLIYDQVSAQNLDLSVKFQPVSGKLDQAAGLVWRYQDAKNYYLVRANALEDNVVLYKVQNGVRSDLPVRGTTGKTYGAKAPVLKNAWNTLTVEVNGPLFSITFNGIDLFEVEDTTFTAAGKSGLWTKADSVMLFEDFSVTPAP